MAMWLEPTELPDGCQRLSTILSARGRLSITDVWRRVRVLFEHGPDHRGEDHACAAAEERSARRAHARRGGAPAQALHRAPAQGARDARGARSRGARRRCAMRAPTTRGRRARSRARSPSASPRPSSSTCGAWWATKARASTTTKRSSGSRARATRRSTTASSPGRCAPRCATGEWRWCANRSTACPSPARTRRRGSTGTGARSPSQGEEMGSRAYYLRIAGQADFYGLLASEELGYVDGAARRDARADRGGSRGRSGRPGTRARAGAHSPRHPRRRRARMALHHPLVRRRAPARRRRACAPQRRLRPCDPHRRPHLAAAQLHAALPDAVPGRVPRLRGHARRRRGVGARPGAPGEPLQHRCALERRCRRPDAGNAAHRALRRGQDRAAQLPRRRA